MHEDPESVDDPGSQALQRDIDGYLLDLARLYTMEMTIEYLAPRFQGQLKALQGTLPVGEAQYRDLTELMRLHHYLRRSWDQNEQRQLLQLQQYLLDLSLIHISLATAAWVVWLPASSIPWPL